MQLQGLRLDGQFSDSTQQSWGHAKNVLLSRGFDEIENEPGDSIVNTDILGVIIGKITTPSDIILFTWNAGHGYIKHFSKTNVLKTIVTIDDGILNFSNITNPTIYVEGVHCYNSEGDLIIAWTMGIYKPMILNVSHVLITPISITTLDQLKDLYLFPEFVHNNFTLDRASVSTSASIINGGKLKSAAYFISLTYELEPDVNTNFGVISNPIFIVDADVLTSYQQFKGNGSLIVTTKAISINVINLDTDRDYFKLAVIQKTETGINCFITPRVKINKATGIVTTIIDDTDKLIPFDVKSVIISAPAFSNVKTIAQSNKRLRIGNVSKPDKLLLSTIYNDVIAHIDVNWVNEKQVSLSTAIGSYKDSIFIFNNRGFRTEEVYALYLGLRLKTGGFYGIYHIPGRAEISNEHTATTIDGDTFKLFQTKSTALKDSGGYYGKMGFWENENEVYPSTYGTISGQNVRHHRFPSAGQIHNWKSGYLHTNKAGSVIQSIPFVTHNMFHGATSLMDTYYGVIDPNPPVSGAMGIYVPASATGNLYNLYTALYSQTVNLVVFARYIVEDYSGFHGRVFMKIDKWSSTGVNTVIYDATTLATIDHDDITLSHTETGISLEPGDSLRIEISMLTGHTSYSTIGNGSTISNLTIYEATIGQEILGLKIALDWASVPSGTKANLEAIIDGWEILYAKRTLNNQLMLDQSIVVKNGIGFRFYGFDSMSNLLNIEPTHAKAELYISDSNKDYTQGFYINEITNYSLDTSVRFSKITKIKYLPAYNISTIPTNENKENCYYFEVYNTSDLFDLRLINLINIKTDLYTNFSNQELISTGVIHSLNDSGYFSFYGGDTYIGHNSVLTFPTGDLTTPRIWYFPAENVLNAGLRYEGENDFEKFFPATNIVEKDISVTPNVLTYIDAMNKAGIANYYLYNNDFHMLNNLRQDNIDNELTSISGKFPNRIYSSMPQPLESTSIYWKRFKVLDYFDMVNNKGAIYKMLGNEYVIYVQTDFSIFRGIVVDKLITGNIDVALKSSEMFDRPLEELLDADGNYIQPWNREGTILTPFGLVTVDLDRGAIYVISDKSNEISKLGIEDWFRNRVKNVMTFGTKETIGSGVILGYDDIYKRLLLSIREQPLINNIIKLGYLYNWFVVNDTRYITSTGWHIPTIAELTTLINYLGGATIAGGKLKEAGIYFLFPNTAATNTSLFNGRGSGKRSSSTGTFNYFASALSVMASDLAGGYVMAMELGYNTDDAIIGSLYDKTTGFSLRALKDSTTLVNGQTGTYIGNDGKIYSTICIGTQEWVSTNLAETKFRNGDLLTKVTDNTAWVGLTTNGYCSYNNDENNVLSIIISAALKDFTLSFQFEKQMWICFHTYIPDKYVWNSNGLFKLNNTNIFKSLIGAYGLYKLSYNGFLPSKDEVNAMYTQLHLYGLGLFQTTIAYWSSTEVLNSEANAYAQSFNDGSVGTFSKRTTTNAVRQCISYTVHTAFSLRSIGLGGGYIFNAINNGDGSYTYYEAGIQDLTPEIWSNIQTAIGVTAEGTAIGTGQANTTAILNQIGHTSSAAKISTDSFDSAYDPSSIDFIFNNNKSERFLLKHVRWVTNIEKNGINYWNETINKLRIYSKNLCSEDITLIKREYNYNVTTYVLENNSGNIIFKDGEWIFDDIKDYLTTPNSAVLDDNFNVIESNIDLSKLWYNKSKFITKFVMVRMIFTNTNNNKKFRITNIEIEGKNIL